MAVTALTTAQLSAVDALVKGSRLGVVPVDLKRARVFMKQAKDAIDEIPLLTKAQNTYNLAYDACHDVGKALLAAYGYRTVAGPGQHEALGRFLRAVFDSPPGDRAARRLDQLRRARNQLRYEARVVGAADAALAAQTARDLNAAAIARGVPT